MKLQIQQQQPMNCSTVRALQKQLDQEQAAIKAMQLQFKRELNKLVKEQQAAESQAIAELTASWQVANAVLDAESSYQ